MALCAFKTRVPSGGDVIRISVQVVYSSDSLQYLRHYLHNGTLEGVTIGLLWLVEKGILDTCLNQAQNARCHRFVPKVYYLQHRVYK